MDAIDRVLAVRRTGPLEVFLADVGVVFRRFEDQDSGCASYGVRTAGGCWFVKTARSRAAARSLERACALHARVRHEAVVPLLHSFHAAGHPVLVYPWVEAEALYHPTVRARPDRADPAGPMARFRQLPLALVHAALDRILDAHLAVSAAGFVAVDFYDGCVMYDFTRHRVHLCDLDEYRPGPFTHDVDRLPGSTRYMAPEEFTRGAVIDERTTVHALGRALRLLLDAGDCESAWRGTGAQLGVVNHATAPSPGDRYATVCELAAQWRAVTTRA
ncbi:serine/threonine protein kinase [Yinghuangia aomiensis]|uniref:Serine/threonine protein kinase n=1 Tax=Yinghuangia aomiensis TaxID=676205 RepID=A0ABP9I899_9ACTN